jgi:UDP-N-acetylglucosamine:LPS N-acetylglucosamine transferase
MTPRLAASTIADIWRLRRRLRQLAPDIVHTNSLKAAIYGGLAGRVAGIPVVWHIRDRIAEN